MKGIRPSSCSILTSYGSLHPVRMWKLLKGFTVQGIWWARRLPTFLGARAKYPSVEGIVRDIPYGSNGRTLDVYLPSEKPKQGATYPTIIFYYGGAWVTGDKRMYWPLAKIYSARGYGVVVADYTLFPRGNCVNMSTRRKL